MRFLLVNPVRTGNDTYLQPPLHLVYVATHIAKAGHEVEILDSFYDRHVEHERTGEDFDVIEAELIQKIVDREYDILGVGSLVTSLDFSKRLVNAVKKAKPHVPIMVGGNMSMPLKDIWFEKTKVDFLVESDGELVIERFCEAWPDLDRIASIPGILVRGEKGFVAQSPPELPQNLDYILPPDWGLLPHFDHYMSAMKRWTNRILLEEDKLAEGDRIMPIVMTRGCPFKCTFCFHLNSQYRKHSVEYLVEMIRSMKRDFGITHLFTWDDLIMLNRSWLEELCDALIKEKLGVTIFTSGGKPNLMNRDLLLKMRKANFKRISYGIESGSQRILDIMRKKTTVEQNYNAVRLSMDAGIFTHLNMVVGMPGETYGTLWETGRFLGRLAREGYITRRNVSFAYATGYPGTELYQYIEDHGLVDDTEQYLKDQTGVVDYTVDLCGLGRGRLKRAVSLMYYYMDMQRAAYDGRVLRQIGKYAVNMAVRVAQHVLPSGVKEYLKSRIAWRPRA